MIFWRRSIENHFKCETVEHGKVYAKKISRGVCFSISPGAQVLVKRPLLEWEYIYSVAVWPKKNIKYYAKLSIYPHKQHYEKDNYIPCICLNHISVSHNIFLSGINNNVSHVLRLNTYYFAL